MDFQYYSNVITMAIGLSVDLAVVAIAMAILYYVSKLWIQMLAKYMFLIVAIACSIQLSIDYSTSTYPLIFTGLILFFVAVFFFELIIELYKIVTTVINPLLHRRFR